jgi:tight adherence protein C
MLLLIIGVLLLGTATAIVIRAMTISHVRAAEQVAQIGTYGFGAKAADTARPQGFRALLDGTAMKLGRKAVGRIASAEEEARKCLVAAGYYTADPVMFVGYRALAGITGALLGAWLLAGPALLFGVAFGAALGWIGPQFVLRKRGDRRLAQIELGLPELIDLLVVTVEAGLGFSGSMQVAATKLPGPLGEEVRLALQEQRMGLSTNEALSGMLGRCDTPSMRSFVRSVIQGETLGVSIGNIMRNLALEMRKRRRAAAEERAQKAPIKMLFPLIFLIFPPMFIVLLYPAVQSFGNAIVG